MLQSIQSHLQAELDPSRWVAVEICEDIDLFRERAGMVDSGTALILPWNESAAAQSLSTGGFRQLVTTRFAIGMVLRFYSQMMGAERATRFDTMKSDVETALAGWEPEGCIAGCELVGGESSPVTTGVSIYVQTWATARFLTGAP